MSPEEIAQTPEGSDCLDINGWFGILDCLEFVFARLDPFRRERETQVGNFLVSKYAFLQIDFEMVFMKSGQDLVKHFQMFFMGIGMH